MTISRSPGLATGTGFVAGGGYSGATSDLDDLVREAAKVLQDGYPGFDVTIRFNSDRRSGGAWLVTDKVDGFGKNAEVGIGAFLVTREGNDRMRERHGIEPTRTPGVYITAHIGKRALVSPEIANESGYYHDVHASLPAAQDFLLEHASLEWEDKS